MLEAAMIVYLTKEVPYIQEERGKPWRDGIAALDTINEKVAAEGALVSPEVDAAVLAAIQFHENRWRPAGPEGDCVTTGGLVASAPSRSGRPVVFTNRERFSCNSFGVMQLNKGAPIQLVVMDQEWKGIKLKDLRDPETNVRAGYTFLKYYKRTCKGNLGSWITAYGSGHCSGGHMSGGAKLRCKTASELLGGKAGLCSMKGT